MCPIPDRTGVGRNFNDVVDDSILALPSGPLRQELHADTVLQALHREAVSRRRDRFATLMAEESWRSLYGRSLMTPPPAYWSRKKPKEAEAIWALPREARRVAG